MRTKVLAPEIINPFLGKIGFCRPVPFPGSQMTETRGVGRPRLAYACVRHRGDTAKGARGAVAPAGLAGCAPQCFGPWVTTAGPRPQEMSHVL